MPDETEVVEFNIDTVTVDEAILLEDTLGIPWLECISTQAGSAKVMRGFVWLYKRRSDPDLKLEDVTFTINNFAQELGAAEEPSGPLPEVSDASPPTSTSSSTSSTASVPGRSASSPSSNSNDGAPVSNR